MATEPIGVPGPAETENAAEAMDFDLPSGEGEDEDTRYEDNLEKIVMYRVWYDDDAAWTNYLRVLSQQDFQPDSDGYSDDDGEAGLDVDYDPESLPFTILEDRDAYANASKDEIRNAFRAWVAARSPERDGKGVSVLDQPTGNPDFPPEHRLKWIPRYRFCLYIDRDAMLSASSEYRARLLKSGRERRHFFTKGYAVLIDSDFDEAYYDNPHRPPPQPDQGTQEEIDEGDYTYEEWLEIVTEGDSGFPPIEGRESKDVGWCFVDLPSYDLHESLMSGVNRWDRYYKRPPQVFPGGELLSERPDLYGERFEQDAAHQP